MPLSSARLRNRPTSMDEPTGPATPVEAANDPDGLPPQQRRAALAAILGAGFLVVLDGAIANVALPSIAQQLHAPPADAVWVVTAYQLAVVMFLLPASALGARLGHHRVFTSGVALFTLASALCAVAASLPWLLAARFLQGLGAAAVMPLGLALLRFTYPRDLLGRAISWNALAVAAATAAGPAIGAFILSAAGWPWLFAVNLPLGILVLAACTRLPRVAPSGGRVDPWSTALNAATFASFVLGSDRLASNPLQGGAWLAAAGACLFALVRREMPKAAPLVPLDLLRGHSFRISIMASVCCYTAQMAGFVTLPFYLQHELGQSTARTGLLMTPWPLAVMLAAPLSARLARRVPTAWLCAAGGACFALGLGLCALWRPGGNPALPIALFTGLAGLGFGFFQTPNNQNMLLSAPKARSGAASGAQGTARLTGMTLGSLLMSLLFAVLPAHAAVHGGLVLATVAALAAGAVSLLRARAAAARSQAPV